MQLLGFTPPWTSHKTCSKSRPQPHHDLSWLLFTHHLHTSNRRNFDFFSPSQVWLQGLWTQSRLTQGTHRVQESSTPLPNTHQPCEDHIGGSPPQQQRSTGRGEPISPSLEEQPMPGATDPAGASISADSDGFVSKKSTPD